LRSGHRDKGNTGCRNIDGIDVAARHELLQIDHLRAFNVERLQFFRGECDELAAFVFVSLDDLFFLYLLAGAGIMGPKRYSSCCAALILLAQLVISVEYRLRALSVISSLRQVREILRFFGWYGSRDLVQANGLRAGGRGRQVNRARH
jgi:hypothetical protein